MSFVQRRINRTLVDFLLAVVVALVAYRGAIFISGTIGMSYEWYIPTTPDLLRLSVANALHAWVPVNFGFPDVYPTYFFAIWWHAVLSWFNVNGAIIERIELVGCSVVGFMGMAAMLRCIGITTWNSRLASLAYVCSPYLYYHASGGHLPAMQSFALVPWIIFWSLGQIQRPRTSLIAVLFTSALVPQPQILLFLPLIVAAFTAPLIGIRFAVFAALCSIAGPVVANAYWLVPAAIGARQTLSTLSDLQTVNVTYGLTHSIVQRSLVDTLLLRSYNGTFLYPTLNTPLMALATFAAFGLPISSAYAVLNATRPLRTVAGLLVIGSVVLLVAFTGPHDLFEAPIVWAYLHLPAMSFFKENYHFAYPLTLAYAVLLAIGLQALSQLGYRRMSVVAGFVAVIGWCSPTLATPDLGGWIRPYEIGNESRPSPVQNGRRVLLLPGTVNLHPALRTAPIDGIDADLVYSGGIGAWLPMPNIGSFVLHRASDDRLGELPDIASIANISDVSLRSNVRSTHDLDNPFSDRSVLDADRFHGVTDWTAAVPHVSRASADSTVGLVRETIHTSMHRRYVVDSTSADAGVSFRLRSSAAVTVRLGTSVGRPDWSTIFDSGPPAERAALFPVRRGRSTLDMVATNGTFAATVTIVRFGSFDGAVTSRHPALVRIDQSAPSCQGSWFSTPQQLVTGADGQMFLAYARPFRVANCPPAIQRFTSPRSAFGATQSTAAVVYDGDLTSVAAARRETSQADSLPDDFIRLDDWWTNPEARAVKADGAIGNDGFERVYRGTCASCFMSYPSRPPATSVTTATGWLPADVASNWVFFWDDVDTGSTYPFIVTTSTEPYTFKVMCSRGNRLFLDATLSGPTLIRSGNRSVTLRSPLRQDAVRRASHWFDLGTQFCATSRADLMITPLQVGMTIVHAAAAVPAEANATKRIVTFDIQAGRKIGIIPRLLPTYLPSGAFGNGVDVDTPRPALSLQTHGHLRLSGTRRQLRFSEIDSAAFQVNVESFAIPTLVQIDEKFENRWAAYESPPGLDAHLFSWCIALRACAPLAWKHLPLNGYANAWIVPADTRKSVFFVFTPDILFTNIQQATLLFVIVISGTFALIALRTRRGALRNR